ncbi:DUF2264 domain-containing protein [Synoicihabitans lomoniglobus]|uniref:DUF2264 domain-containing protein n=1 Tax=Synoicihabitans lomoniglobus TaxID=2909285 RepID=A0AAF0I568_9BACT|nr:DUF2264 domain-containing protein [Opitutaceae bacterium LMO-M01]WED67213.1 DUF2264 domain-containing protein [Opitutaceae bacterium LMO-M01]
MTYVNILNLPDSYRHWQNNARALLEPLVPLMREGYADLPITGQASDHDAQADRLESFARPLLLAAHWLQTVAVPEDADFRRTIGDWFRAGLAIGSDPESPHYWGPDANYHQHHVEIGLLALALQIAPAELWDPLPPAHQDRIARWLGTSRGNGIVNNNHYFMGIHILEFLIQKGYGRPTDRVVIDTFLDRLEGMHRGGGWFEDGINQAYDHYNAYAFHFYGLWWAKLHGRDQPERAQRWKDWGKLFVRDYVHFFAASGEHPAFGRSITYRFNGINVFGLAVATDSTDLPLGQLRRLCTRNVDFFLRHPIQQSQGLLSIGWLNEFPDLGESYSCAGSPYWCAKGLSPMLLPPEHPFWHEAEVPLPSEQGDHTHVVPTAGLTVRSIDGEVEIINAGSQISNMHVRYGAWKWSKTAYRTGVDFTIARPAPTNWSADSALTLHLPDGRVFGRHSTVAIEMTNEHARYVSNLGFKTEQANCSVDTGVWWNRGWILQVHAYECRQPGVLRVGGYALSDHQSDAFTIEDASPVLSAWKDGQGTTLQPIHGFTSTAWERRLDDSTPRTHIRAPYHVTATADSPTVGAAAGETGVLIALAWTGPDRAEAQPWALTATAAGAWTLLHPELGEWHLAHDLLPAIPAPS